MTTTAKIKTRLDVLTYLADVFLALWGYGFGYRSNVAELSPFEEVEAPDSIAWDHAEELLEQAERSLEEEGTQAESLEELARVALRLYYAERRDDARRLEARAEEARKKAERVAQSAREVRAELEAVARYGKAL